MMFNAHEMGKIVSDVRSAVCLSFSQHFGPCASRIERDEMQPVLGIFTIIHYRMAPALSDRVISEIKDVHFVIYVSSISCVVKIRLK